MLRCMPWGQAELQVTKYVVQVTVYTPNLKKKCTFTFYEIYWIWPESFSTRTIFVNYTTLHINFYMRLHVESSWFQTFAMYWMLYAFFWVIPRSLKFICGRFGTLYSIFIGRWVPMKMEQCVPKRRHINFRRRGITQKKAYSIESSCLLSHVERQFFFSYCHETES